jgi:hypothetical protein
VIGLDNLHEFGDIAEKTASEDLGRWAQFFSWPLFVLRTKIMLMD